MTSYADIKWRWIVKIPTRDGREFVVRNDTTRQVTYFAGCVCILQVRSERIYPYWYLYHYDFINHGRSAQPLNWLVTIVCCLVIFWLARIPNVYSIHVSFLWKRN